MQLMDWNSAFEASPAYQLNMHWFFYYFFLSDVLLIRQQSKAASPELCLAVTEKHTQDAIQNKTSQ